MKKIIIIIFIISLFLTAFSQENLDCDTTDFSSNTIKNDIYLKVKIDDISIQYDLWVRTGDIQILKNIDLQIDELIKNYGELSELQYLKGIMYMYYYKDYDKALEYLKKSSDKNPKNAYTYFLMGNIYVQLNDYNKAFLELNKAIKLEPNNDTFIYLYALIYESIDENHFAIEYLNKALKINKNHEYYISRGNNYAHIGEYEKAILDYDEALNILNNMINNKGNLDKQDLYYRIMYKKATLFRYMYEEEKGLVLIDEIIKNIDKISNDYFQKIVYLEKVNLLYDLKRYDEGIEIYQNLLLDSKEYYFCALYAKLLYKVNDPSESIKILDKIEDLDEEYKLDFVSYLRGINFISLKEYKKALNEINKTNFNFDISYRDKNFLLKGLIYEALNEEKMALNYYKIYLEKIEDKDIKNRYELIKANKEVENIEVFIEDLYKQRKLLY
ncbi:tetratricopeptide repeat protein [Oceanotoga sp. DSM 15011]|uniref:tetratricopeptide repeat protein n=1 Tax=Oceanotoga sp. DSM 15011 TaxID=2984951 RepID=UPI0021F46239|nr:tetratricopeptide repeat protein [Oceanotoga sp. DSM 15011]UYO99342.1 tetratricopeptide repeat protein [Oceanotoga sp. DSM 15011]